MENEEAIARGAERAYENESALLLEKSKRRVQEEIGKLANSLKTFILDRSQTWSQQLKKDIDEIFEKENSLLFQEFEKETENVFCYVDDHKDIKEQ